MTAETAVLLEHIPALVALSMLQSGATREEMGLAMAVFQRNLEGFLAGDPGTLEYVADVQREFEELRHG